MTTFFNFILLIPPLVAVIFVFRCVKFEREPKGESEKIVIAEYSTPDNLTPAETGLIYDRVASGQDITAEVINLARKGYVLIEKTTTNDVTDYQLNLIKETDESLNLFEKELLLRFFKTSKQVVLSSLKYKFVDDMEQIGNKMWESVVSKGYAKANPRPFFAKYAFLAIGLAFFGIFIASETRVFVTMLYMLSGLIIFVCLPFMTILTAKGLETRRYLYGFKKYLEVAEKNRIIFHSGPQADSFEFDEMAPYAIALDVIRDWKVVFDPIYRKDKTNQAEVIK